MCETGVAIDLTYVDPDYLSWIWFCCFVLEFFHFVLEISWKCPGNVLWNLCGHPELTLPQLFLRQDSRNLKNESENNDDGSNGDNNSNNTNLTQKLIFQVDTGKNVA